MTGTERPWLLRPRVAIPFFVTGTIWGSTWFVITGQIAGVEPAWAVTFRFMLATPAMFLLALVMKRSLKLGARGHVLALGVGIAQFWGNFNFVYVAEHHLTSGIVAVMFALLMVPNAILARFLLGEQTTRNFILGSLVAMAGVGLLLLHEARTSPLGGDPLLGIALALGGMLAASIANVVQANPTGRALPMVSMLAWALLYGTATDALYALATAGPPQWPADPGFWAGTAYLALVGSVVTFPLYYNLVREIGAGLAAYSAIVTVVVAMLLSTLFEGYRWTGLTVLGCLLAIAGMVLALRSRETKSIKTDQTASFRHPAD